MERRSNYSPAEKARYERLKSHYKQTIREGNRRLEYRILQLLKIEFGVRSFETNIFSDQSNKADEEK
jgi:hypothetical protein